MDDVIPEQSRKYNVKIEELYLEVDHVHAAAAHHHPVGDDRPPDLNILHHEPLEVVQDQFLGRICKQNVTKMSKIFTAPHSSPWQPSKASVSEWTPR